MQILDGQGTGIRAGVDQFFRLKVFATSTSQEHHASSVIEEAFALCTGKITPGGLVVGAGFNGPVLYIQNQNAERRISVQHISLSSTEDGGIWTLVKNPVRDESALANNTDIIPDNINFVSGKSALHNADVWDGVGLVGIAGITGGSVVDTYITEGNPIPVPIDGSYIVGSNNIISLNYNGPAGGTIAATIRFFYEGVIG